MPVPSQPRGEPPRSTLSVIGAEARVTLRDRRVIARDLLRVEEERRFELRSVGERGMALLDIANGIVHATLTGAPRASLEVEFVVIGMEPMALDAWCTLGARNFADVSIADGFGRLTIPDLTARDPSAAPIEVFPGRYVLSAVAHDASVALRLAQVVSARTLRAAM